MTITNEEFEEMYDPVKLLSDLSAKIGAQVPTGMDEDAGLVMDVASTTCMVHGWIADHFMKMRTIRWATSSQFIIATSRVVGVSAIALNNIQNAILGE